MVSTVPQPLAPLAWTNRHAWRSAKVKSASAVSKGVGDWGGAADSPQAERERARAAARVRAVNFFLFTNCTSMEAASAAALLRRG